MVCPSKTPVDTDGPERLCPNCRVEQILSDTAGWEWVDDGRNDEQREPRIPTAWLLIEACIWLLAAVGLCFLIWG